MRSLGKGSVASVVRVALDFAWYVGLVAMGGILIGGLILGLNRSQLFLFTRRGLLMLHADFLNIGFAQVAVKNPQVIVLGILGLALLTLGVGLAIIYQLRKVFATLRQGTPFTVENAGRLRTIGLIMIGGSLLQSLAAAVMGSVMVRSLSIKGVELSVRSGLQLGSVFIGLVILVLAEVFGYGAALQEEQDLTV